MDFDRELELENAGIDAFDFSIMDDEERAEALADAGLDPEDFDGVEYDAEFDAWYDLQNEGLSLDELRYMDEDERREALTDAGLDPEDYESAPTYIPATPLRLKNPEPAAETEQEDSCGQQTDEKTVEQITEPDNKKEIKSDVDSDTGARKNETAESDLKRTEEKIPFWKSPLTYFAVFCLAIMCYLTGSLLWEYEIKPGRNYKEALAQMEAMDYANAETAFAAIGKYRDAPQLSIYCRSAAEYKDAETYLGKKYDLPEIILTRDVKYQAEIDELKTRISDLLEQMYQCGLDAIDSGDYALAMKQFNGCPGYKDADALRSYSNSALGYEYRDTYAGELYDLEQTRLQYETRYQGQVDELYAHIQSLKTEYLAEMQREERERIQAHQAWIRNEVPFVGMSVSNIDNTSLGTHYDTTDESYWKDGKAHRYTNYYWKEHGHTLFIATVSDDRGYVTEVTNYLDSEYLKRAREADKHRERPTFDYDDYDTDEYADPEDFWYDHADEFDSYEDALDYWEENY